MKLIKLKEDHYVVVDETEIKQGDWMIRDGEQPTLVTPNFWWDFGVPYKKITHSTQPIEIIHTSGVTMTNPPMGYINIIELPLSEVKELIGEVDIEKRAKTLSIKQNGVEYWDWQNGFKVGYNQALEDNKDKKYTEEDMKTAFSRYAFVSTNNQPYNEDELLTEFYEFIQSLQPKTEWEVEFINGKLTLKQ